MTKSMWAEDRFYVDVAPTKSGGFEILGQDLRPSAPGGDEYEYAITVHAADVPAVIAALGGEPRDDVIELLIANAPMIIRAGERTWLRSLGIKTKFWSRVG